MSGQLACLLQMTVLPLIGIVMYWLISRYRKAADKLISRIEK